jgi:hypothetical protein
MTPPGMALEQSQLAFTRPKPPRYLYLLDDSKRFPGSKDPFLGNPQKHLDFLTQIRKRK